MRKKAVLSVLMIFFLTSAISLTYYALPVFGEPITINVPTDYPTIQQAINAASSGDTISVAPGTYYENLQIGKTIFLQGSDKETTIINGGGSGDVIFLSASYVSIMDLTVTNGYNGIQLIADYNINHVTIKDVKITSISGQGIRAGHSGDYHLIENCVFQNNWYNFYAHQFSYSTITNCEVFDGEIGITVGHASYTTISDMKIHDLVRGGIYLDTMQHSVITNCELYALERGINCGGLDSRYNTISNNIIYSNNKGISMGNSRYNNIFENNIFNNNYGIYVDPNPNYGNLIYHNDFVDNTYAAVVSYSQYTNSWDNGYPSGGNYYSDYAGVDVFSGPNQDIPGMDGIGDTPYVIASNNVDNYPVMNPYFPPTPEEAIVDLVENVESMNLQQGIDNSIDTKLENALESLDAINADQRNDAVNKLYALINSVEAQRGNKLTDEQADYLIAETLKIISLIEG